jgi:hypothetical protein
VPQKGGDWWGEFKLFDWRKYLPVHMEEIATAPRENVA